MFCNDTEVKHKDTLTLFKTAPNWTDPRVCWGVNTTSHTMHLYQKSYRAMGEQPLCIPYTNDFNKNVKNRTLAILCGKILK